MSIKEQNQDRPQNRRGPMGHGGPPMGGRRKACDFKGPEKAGSIPGWESVSFYTGILSRYRQYPFL